MGKDSTNLPNEAVDPIDELKRVMSQLGVPPRPVVDSVNDVWTIHKLKQIRPRSQQPGKRRQ
jgi:hypothetical protein